jgi:hypothetical protein
MIRAHICVLLSREEDAFWKFNNFRGGSDVADKDEQGKSSSF